MHFNLFQLPPPTHKKYHKALKRGTAQKISPLRLMDVGKKHSPLHIGPAQFLR